MDGGAKQGEGATARRAPVPTFRWEEIQKHNVRTDQWLVVDRKVYNVTAWAKRHPGGHRVIGHYAGEDATVRVLGTLPATSPCCRRESGAMEDACPGRRPDLRR